MQGQKPMVVVKAQVGWRQPFYRGGGPMAGGHVEGNVPGSAIAANRMDAEPDGGQSKRSRRVPPVVFPETSGMNCCCFSL